jgi:Zn finger protein HypA/HybF involved in hydrogenase expression
MHEFSIATEIVRITLEQVSLWKNAQQLKQEFQPAVPAEPGTQTNTHLKGIKLKIGTLTGIYPDSLLMYLEIIFKEKGIEQLDVKIETVPARYGCQCGHTYLADSLLSPCPVCQGFERSLIEGNECTLDSIDLDGI